VDRFAVSRNEATEKFCGADFLGVALDLQETGAALAGMWGCARPPCVGHQG